MSWFGMGSQAEEADSAEGEEDTAASVWDFASGALSKLKDQTAKAIETTKKDFNEFGSALNTETKDMDMSTAALMAGVGTSDVLCVENEEENKEKPKAALGGGDEGDQIDKGPGMMDRADQLGDQLEEGLEQLSSKLEKVGDTMWAALPSVFGALGPTLPSKEGSPSSGGGSSSSFTSELKRLQSDKGTFLKDAAPEDSAAFDVLMTDFTDRYEEFWSNEIISLLVDASVRKLYDELVPSEVSEELFWCRYVFKRRALEDKESSWSPVACFW